MRNVITDKMAKTCSDIKNEDVNTISGNMVVRLQRQLWDLMENPEANMVAKTGICKYSNLCTCIKQNIDSVSVISVTFVVISTCCMCLGTIHALQTQLDDGSLVENSFIDGLETMSVLWFSLEYVLRLVSCPDKIDFLRDRLNILDVAAVLPFYVPIAISWVDTLAQAQAAELTEESPALDSWNLEAGVTVQEFRFASQSDNEFILTDSVSQISS